MGACGVSHSWGPLLLPAVPRGPAEQRKLQASHTGQGSARDPGSMASPRGREQHGGGVLDLLPPHPQRWWQQAVGSTLAALGEGDTQAAMLEQLPQLGTCFQRDMGCTAVV